VAHLLLRRHGDSVLLLHTLLADERSIGQLVNAGQVVLLTVRGHVAVLPVVHVFVLSIQTQL
jgi:hypothetical protein